MKIIPYYIRGALDQYAETIKDIASRSWFLLGAKWMFEKMTEEQEKEDDGG